MSKKLQIEFEAGIAEVHSGSWSGLVPTSIGVSYRSGQIDFVDFLTTDGNMIHFDSVYQFENYIKMYPGCVRYYRIGHVATNRDGRNGYRFESITTYKITHDVAF